ncbi:N-acetylneuraminate synthase family protein [Mongoliibacter ruber]|uniref:N-acetylneuraminate synthase/N,N'-diacetyllegionaminate synthase n=1 Tax=Mongoliibacter ruber TaxID=1750599 RepID=A0A2T0WG76_9BACT|nr:N-acetylneuraminate synthase family protein [Mongoliibacter ruber]PRY85672.1 N-acetylneuraminate synthase/N,N'-diacetyllegionaminate synthase [Mongoliibacter ruber]
MNFSLKQRTKNSVFIIAEIGNNHNGSKKTAFELIDIAAESGVDAVKFQTFTGLDIVTPKVKADEYKGWNVKGYAYWFEFLDSIALPLEDHLEVFNYAINKGLIPFSTPTSSEIVGFLEKINTPLYKIASMDLTNIKLLKSVADTGKPVIISTGMGTDEEIRKAISIFSKNELAILHCISDYPTKPENANLKAVSYIKERYKVLTGLSDHSVTNVFSLGAVALGGRIIEKHITYSRKEKRKAEHHFSLEPKELKLLVESIRTLEKGLGENKLIRTPDEDLNKFKYRRSLHLNKALNKGDRISIEDISILRPNIGDAPSEFDNYIGKELVRDIGPWTGLNKDMIKG